MDSKLRCVFEIPNENEKTVTILKTTNSKTKNVGSLWSRYYGNGCVNVKTNVVHSLSILLTHVQLYIHGVNKSANYMVAAQCKKNHAFTGQELLVLFTSNNRREKNGGDGDLCDCSCGIVVGWYQYNHWSDITYTTDFTYITGTV